jgi:mannitol-1-phosphate/altronate dehydrogenase
MDGSAKLPQRILPILAHHGFESPAAAQVLADWWTLLEKRAAKGEPLDDPAEAELRPAIGCDEADEGRFLAALKILGVSRRDLPEGWATASLSARP